MSGKFRALCGMLLTGVGVTAVVRRRRLARLQRAGLMRLTLSHQTFDVQRLCELSGYSQRRVLKFLVWAAGRGYLKGVGSAHIRQLHYRRLAHHRWELTAQGKNYFKMSLHM